MDCGVDDAGTFDVGTVEVKPKTGFVCGTLDVGSTLLTADPNNGNFGSLFRDPKLIVAFVVVAKLAGTTGTGNGTDMTGLLFFEPNTKSVVRVSLGVSSAVCLLLEATVGATVPGLVCDIEAPNLKPDSAGVETILVDADKSLSFDVLEDLTANENVVAAREKRCSGYKSIAKRFVFEFFLPGGSSLFVSFSLLRSPNENVFAGPSVTLALG